VNKEFAAVKLNEIVSQWHAAICEYFVKFGFNKKPHKKLQADYWQKLDVRFFLHRPPSIDILLLSLSKAQPYLSNLIEAQKIITEHKNGCKGGFIGMLKMKPFRVVDKAFAIDCKTPILFIACNDEKYYYCDLHAENIDYRLAGYDVLEMAMNYLLKLQS
jgi:hypothetical protein